MMELSGSHLNSQLGTGSLTDSLSCAWVDSALFVVSYLRRVSPQKAGHTYGQFESINYKLRVPNNGLHKERKLLRLCAWCDLTEI